MNNGLTYDCQRERLGPVLASKFSPLVPDAETDAWIARWTAQPFGFFASRLSEVLSTVVTTYDAHGIMGGYPMHLLSQKQWADLLSGDSPNSLLDVGAGGGYVTEYARPHFRDIVCTETSARLRKLLAARGLQVSELDLTVASLGRRFDVVACLNVIDRTSRPLTLLRSLLSHVNPDGRLIVSVPLPARPHVHVQGGTIAPSERLPSFAGDWETAVRELSEKLFAPLGVGVERLARAPYLSRGDRHAPLYVLDAAVWVLRAPAL